MEEEMFLIHHGVLGQKWGIRRYQNEDGSYKSGAEGRYAPDSNSSSGKIKRFAKEAKKSLITVGNDEYKFRRHETKEQQYERGKKLTEKGVGYKKTMLNNIATQTARNVLFSMAATPISAVLGAAVSTGPVGAALALGTATAITVMKNIGDAKIDAEMWRDVRDIHEYRKQEKKKK